MKNDKLAFLFPGQGSQKIGMLSELALGNSIVEDTFSEASEVLGYNVWATVQEGPQEKLNMTEVTQPVLLTASVALWRIWAEKNGNLPVLMAGHSLGEWSALVCAEVIDFADAVKLVRSRGRYMQDAVPAGVGAMAAIIGLADDTVEEICSDISTEDAVVTAVNYNSPGQLVIAGHKVSVDTAVEKLKQAGARKAMPLPVSAPFHTPLMQPAANRLAEEINATTFSEPKTLVVHNVTANTEVVPDKIKQILIDQIYSPVRWVDCINHLSEKGVAMVVECGPGKVLSGLCRRINPDVSSHSIDNNSALETTLSSV